MAWNTKPGHQRRAGAPIEAPPTSQSARNRRESEGTPTKRLHWCRNVPRPEGLAMVARGFQMSKQVGEMSLSVTAESRTEYFLGAINSRVFSADIMIRPNPRKGQQKEGAPDWVVFAKERGQRFECGAAWTRTPRIVGKVPGGRYLTLKIMDETMVKPLWLTAFPAQQQPTDDVTEFHIIWQPPQAQGGARKASEPEQASSGSGRGDLDDEIPF